MTETRYHVLSKSESVSFLHFLVAHRATHVITASGDVCGEFGQTSLYNYKVP